MRIGRTANGDYTPCRAKPENVGKGRCHHTEHRNVAASEWKDIQEKQIEKKAGSAKRISKPVIQFREPVEDEMLEKLSDDNIDNVIRNKIDSLEYRRAELLKDIEPVNKPAEPIDDTIRAEANRRNAALDKRINQVRNSSDTPIAVLHELRGKNIDMRRYTHGKTRENIDSLMDYNDVVTAIGVNHAENGDKLVFDVGNPPRRYSIDAVEFDAKKAKNEYLHKLESLQSDFHAAIDNMNTTKGRLSSSQLRKLIHKNVIDYDYAMSNHLYEIANERKQEDSDAEPRRREASLEANNLERTISRTRPAMEKELPIAREWLQNRKKADELLSGLKPGDPDKHPKRNSHGELDYIGSLDDGRSVFRSHSDKEYIMSDDSRVRARGDRTQLVIAKDDNVDNAEPLTGTVGFVNGIEHTRAGLEECFHRETQVRPSPFWSFDDIK